MELNEDSQSENRTVFCVGKTKEGIWTIWEVCGEEKSGVLAIPSVMNLICSVNSVYGAFREIRTPNKSDDVRQWRLQFGLFAWAADTKWVQYELATYIWSHYREALGWLAFIHLGRLPDLCSLRHERNKHPTVDMRIPDFWKKWKSRKTDNSGLCDRRCVSMPYSIRQNSTAQNCVQFGECSVSSPKLTIQ